MARETLGPIHLAMARFAANPKDAQAAQVLGRDPSMPA